MRISFSFLKENVSLVMLFPLLSAASFLAGPSGAYALPAFMQNKIAALVAIFLVMLLTNMWRFGEYGISVTFFLFFGLLAVFGFVPAALAVILITLFYILFSTSPTPLDLIITKKVDVALMRGMYLFLAEAFAFVLFYFYGEAWVLSNLVLAYMIVFALYYSVGTIVYLLSGPVGVPQCVLRLAVSVLFNLWLATNFGIQYVNYLYGLAF